MGIFSNIMNRILGHSASAAPASGTAAGSAAAPASGSAAAGGAAGGAPALAQADVEKILAEMAAKKGGGGNWRTSIVDLLKMLDLDSSLDARKELATELNVNAGPHGSAEQNIALSKAVWQQLAQNGGRVPDSLRN